MDVWSKIDLITNYLCPETFGLFNRKLNSEELDEEFGKILKEKSEDE